MRVNTRLVIDIATYKVLERESFEYDGPVAKCWEGPGERGESDLDSDRDSRDGTWEGMTGGPMAGMMGSMAPGSLGAGTAGSMTGIGGGLSGSEAAAKEAAGKGDTDEGGWGSFFKKVGAIAKGALIGFEMGGPPGAMMGGLISGLAGVVTPGAPIPDQSGQAGMMKEGQPGLAGGDRKRAAAAEAAKGIADKKPSALQEKPTPQKEEEKKARKRPQTILTSPLGLRSKPTIRRATLLGG